MDTMENKHIVESSAGAKDGQEKCPVCGATDIALNTRTGKLRCNFCRHEFEPKKAEGFASDAHDLQGEVIGSGAADIQEGAENLVTLRCESCGAEVVIDTADVTHARCCWCRNTLSINNKLPNGAVPDLVLPFRISKSEAEEEIRGFVSKRQFFAHPAFKKEFTTENIMGVYFPYMMVDANAHVHLEGEGERETKRYEVDLGNDKKETRYDADRYRVERDFDLLVEGLTIESSADRLDRSGTDKTNNIINSIMPFDTENCECWNAGFLKGYASEKRDMNVEDLGDTIDAQLGDIARCRGKETIGQYDRGVHWEKETLDTNGRQWRAVYLPVWLYSYQEKKGDKSLLHYTAVNARTKETMGSIPLHMPRLLLMTLLVEILCFFAESVLNRITDSDWTKLIYAGGLVFFWTIYEKYRNRNARHDYERSTGASIENVVENDQYLRHCTNLKNSRIEGCNEDELKGKNFVRKKQDTGKEKQNV